MSQVTLVRVRVQATVPTQPFGNVVLEAEETLSIDAGENARNVLQNALLDLRYDIEDRVALMNGPHAARWLQTVRRVDHAPIEIAP